MENEIMNVEIMDAVEPCYNDDSNAGFAVGMLVGGLVIAVGVTAIKWGMKKLSERKARKSEGVVKFEEVEKKTDDEITVE